MSKCKLEKDPQKKIEGLTKILGKYPEQAGIYFEIAEYYKKTGILALKTNSSPTEGEQSLKKAIFLKSIQCKGYSHKSTIRKNPNLFKEVISSLKIPDQHRLTTNTTGKGKDINDLEFEQNSETTLSLSPSIVRRDDLMNI